MGMDFKLDRRKFLKYIAAGTCGSLCHHLLQPNGMIAYAFGPQAEVTGKIKRIIEIFFFGGYCDYGFMPQHNNGALAKYPTLYRNPSQAAALVNGHSDLSLHLSFAPLIAEAGGHVAVIMKTGRNDYKFSRSHEDAQNANQRIDLDPARGDGMGVGALIMQALGDPFGGIAFGGNSTFMSGGSITARSINNLVNAGLPGFYNSDWFQLTKHNIAAADPGPKTSEQKMVGDAIEGMEDTASTLQGIGSLTPPIAFPNTTMGNYLADITRLIMGKKGSVFYIPYGGFDTHSNEAATHTTLFTTLNDALLAFVRNLKTIAEPGGGTAWDSTAIITRTDFGRTVENNARGTDHGMAHNQLVIGGSIKGGVYGDPLTEQQYLAVNDYYGPSYVQFSAGEPIKELVEIGMGLTNCGFPVYPGNRFAPIGFI